MPYPLASDSDSEVMGVASAPLVAYLHKGQPALVRLFSLKLHDDVHLLRLTEPCKSLQASRKYFAVGFTKQVELYDSLRFQALFSVQCHGAAQPTFALGHRWLAYNLPAQEATLRRASMKDGLQYLGQAGVGQDSSIKHNRKQIAYSN